MGNNLIKKNNIQYIQIEGFASKPHVSILLNIQERQNTERNNFHSNVFGVDNNNNNNSNNNIFGLNTSI